MCNNICTYCLHQTEVNKINHQLGAGTQMDAALEISIKEFDRTKDWGSEKFLVLLTDGE